MLEQHVQKLHLLRRYTGFRRSHVWLPVPLDPTSIQWREELREQSLVIGSEPILRDGWRVLSRGIFMETGSLQGCGDVTRQRRGE